MTAGAGGRSAVVACVGESGNGTEVQAIVEAQRLIGADGQADMRDASIEVHSGREGAEEAIGAGRKRSNRRPAAPAPLACPSNLQRREVERQRTGTRLR